MHSFAGRDLVTMLDIERADIETVLDVAEEMERIVRGRKRTDLLADKILATLFYQSSTRTRLSFESAMLRLGGGVLGIADPKTSRAGGFYQESLHDTIRMVECYADVIAIRHPKDGAPAEAAEAAWIPVINAGDGYNEHPTQTLTDLFTIRREKGRIDGLTFAMVSDMNMRALHSLPVALAQFNPKIYFISPPDKSMPERWKMEFDRLALDYEERTSIDEVIQEVDVFYLHAVITPSYSVGYADVVPEKEQTPPEFVFTLEKLKRAKRGAIVLHPLNRTDELPPEIDRTGAARYFNQASYGVAVRMAVLSLLLGRAP